MERLLDEGWSMRVLVLGASSWGPLYGSTLRWVRATSSRTRTWLPPWRGQGGLVSDALNGRRSSDRRHPGRRSNRAARVSHTVRSRDTGVVTWINFGLDDGTMRIVLSFLAQQRGDP